jgi:hypothetical protein
MRVRFVKENNQTIKIDGIRDFNLSRRLYATKYFRVISNVQLYLVSIAKETDPSSGLKF